MIAAILPTASSNFTVRNAFLFPKKVMSSSAFLANINSFVFDYITRQMLAGLHLSDYIVKQLPLIMCDSYLTNTLCFITPVILELSYTAWDMQSFADELWSEADYVLRATILRQWEENALATGGGHTNTQRPEWAEPPSPDGFPRPPFKWDETRRAALRAELDGLYAHLYSLTRDEFAYILDTFPIVRRKDEAKFGEFRTKRLCLEAYDRLVDSDLIPAEARALQKSSVLQQHDVLKESARPVVPAAAPAPSSPAPRKTTGRLEAAAAERLPAAEKPQHAAEEKPPVEKQPDAPRQSAPAAPTREESAAGRSQPATGRSQPAAGKRSPAEKTPPGAEEQPMLTDFGLYKCLDCGRMVLGYDRVNHARKDHHGVEPEWKKMGK